MLSEQITTLATQVAQLEADLAACQAGSGPDITAPDTMLVQVGIGNAWDTHAVFNISASDNAPGPLTFEGRLDGSPFAPITSPVALDVAVGAHVYEVRATDAAGNVDPTPALIRWTVTTPPLQASIVNFGATPPTIKSGETLTLDALVVNAIGLLTLKSQVAGLPVVSESVALPLLRTPTVDTGYELTAQGAPGTPPAKASISVVVTPIVVGPPPPPPAQGENPLAIYDGGVGLARDEVYKKMFPWKNSGGDWTDASGAPQGTVAFGTTTVTKGQTTVARADATSLVKSFAAGQEIQICVRGSAIMSFKSRTYGADGPQLEVVYADNSTALLAAVADATCDPSTAAEQGTNPSLALSYNGKAYIKFPAPLKPVGKATLVLSPYDINEAGKVTLFKFAVHWDKMSVIAPYAPVANPFITTESFARDELEPQGFLPTYWGIFGDPAHFRPGDDWNQRNIVSDGSGGQALQITFDPRGSSALNSAVPFPGYAEADECEWEFEIKMLSDILVGARDGFKLFAGVTSKTKSDDAYFCGWSGAGPNAVGTFGTLLAGNGGSKAHGMDGWSMRWDSWNSPPIGHPMRGRFLPMQYCYHPEQSDYYGDAWSWLGQNTAMVVDTWHKIKMRAKINTCTLNSVGGYDAPKDAEFDGWLDGAPVLRKRGFRLRTTLTPLIGTPGVQGSPPFYGVKNTKLSLGRIWLNSYHGGTSSPIARCSFQVRNFKAAKLA